MPSVSTERAAPKILEYIGAEFSISLGHRVQEKVIRTAVAHNSFSTVLYDMSTTVLQKQLAIYGMKNCRELVGMFANIKLGLTHRNAMNLASGSSTRVSANFLARLEQEIEKQYMIMSFNMGPNIPKFFDTH